MKQLLVVVLATVLAVPACRAGASPRGEAGDPHRAALAEAVRAARRGATIDATTSVTVDGVAHVAVSVEGRFLDGGATFDVVIAGPDGSAPVEVRRVDGSLLQRGAFVDALAPAAAGRWLEVATEPSGSTAGLVGRGGLLVLDLLDDVRTVERVPGGYAGTLDRLGVGTLELTPPDGVSFESTVDDTGRLRSFVCRLDDGGGGEVEIAVRLQDHGEVAPVVRPPEGEVVAL